MQGLSPAPLNKNKTKKQKPFLVYGPYKNSPDLASRQEHVNL
jgi:hypothetical protein